MSEGKGERVTLNNEVFIVSDRSIHPGYNVTGRSGGALRKGAHVRIHSWNNEILELEIKK